MRKVHFRKCSENKTLCGKKVPKKERAIVDGAPVCLKCLNGHLLVFNNLVRTVNTYRSLAQLDRACKKLMVKGGRWSKGATDFKCRVLVEHR